MVAVQLNKKRENIPMKKDSNSRQYKIILGLLQTIFKYCIEWNNIDIDVNYAYPFNFKFAENIG